MVSLRPWFSSLRSRLLALVLLATAPAVGLILYRAIEDARERIARLEQDVRIQAASVAGSLGQLTEGVRQVLVALAQLDEVRGDNAEACSRLLANLNPKYPQYDNFSIVRADGTIFASGLPFDQELSAAGLSWFERVMATRDFACGNYRIGRVTKKPTVNFAYPITDADGRVQRVVLAAIDLKWLGEQAKARALPAGAVLTVLDGNGTVLARSEEPEKWLGQPLPETPLVRRVLRETAGVAELRGLDGVTRIYGLATVTPHGGLHVTVGFPRQVALADVRVHFRRDMLWLGVTVVLALGAAWWLGGAFVVRPGGAGRSRRRCRRL